jgi:hypothetical protein
MYSRAIVALSFTVSLAVVARADPPSTSDLVWRMPEATNAIAVVQVGQILNSPFAFQAGWRNLDHTVYLAGTVPINPNVVRLAIGSQFSLEHPGESWSLGLIAMAKPVTLEKLVETYKGRLETIADTKIAIIPPYGFVVLLRDDLIAGMDTADRQQYARWLKWAQSPDRQPVIAPYLQQAASRHATNHVLIAVHTDDLINPAAVRPALLVSKVFESDPALLERAAKFLERLRGVRIVVQLGQDIRATVHFDSGELATRDLEPLKQFFVYVLNRAGAELVDLPAARVSTEVRTLTLQFKLYDAELGRIMALMSSPLIHPNPDEFKSLKLSPAGVNVEITGAYFRAVNRVLDDLRRRSRSADNYAYAALWHETAAKTIETTSVLHVDPAVVAYGREVADKLMAIADSLHGVPISLMQLESRKNFYVFGTGGSLWRTRRGGFFGFPGNYSVQTNIPEVEQKQLDVITKDAETREKVWQSLDAARAAVRREMATKYHVDLDQPPGNR